MEKAIVNKLKKSSTIISGPDGNPLAVLSLSERNRLCRHFRLSPREVELHSLEAGIVPLRYLKNIGTLSIEGQRRLLSSKVAVVGLGGLGGLLVELLARVGVGGMLIIDGDRFVEDNLNRQILLQEKDIDLIKARLAEKRVRDINSAIEVEKWEGFVTEENAQHLLSSVNLVCDALDNISSRLLLQSTCEQLNIPLVHGAVAGFSGQVTSIFPGDASLSVIYGDEGITIQRGVEVQEGNLPGTVGMVASLQAQEVIKILSGKGAALRKKLLVIDTERGEIRHINL
ncbi:hypothetical protein CEE39_06955 [bacterium (candidate division B38) B3_B38]|nr:MAG: hypothetical protein CEE39_06955 [bacterium (candidate division B38) B3_B38]